jgi:hypothetical protein
MDKITGGVNNWTIRQRYFYLQILFVRNNGFA